LAVVFNLTNKRKFKVRNADKAIHNNKFHGPCFDNVLLAAKEPFNSKKACVSREDNNYV
jgi:hypothetical protein